MSGSFCAGEYQTDEEDKAGSSIINFHLPHSLASGGLGRDYREGWRLKAHSLALRCMKIPVFSKGLVTRMKNFSY